MKKLLPFILLSVVAATLAIGAVSSFYVVDDGGHKIPFGTGGELHFENISGLPNHVTIFSSSGDISSHTGDATIHFTESSIDHDNILNVGTYGHDQLDAHVVDSTVHFTESSIDHTALQNIGTYSHTALDSHVDDSTVHFTEGSIDHAAIQNIGTYSHTALDAHVDDSTVHFTLSSILHDNLFGASGYYNHSTINAHIDDTSIHGGGSGSGTTLPVGLGAFWVGDTAPDGWVIADGSPVSETSDIGIWRLANGGTSNGDGTVDLPDLRLRFLLGSGTGYPLHTTGGTFQRTISAANLPTNTMKKAETSNYYTTTWANGTQANLATGDNLNTFGQGQAMDITNPYFTINYILYAGE